MHNDPYMAPDPIPSLDAMWKQVAASIWNGHPPSDEDYKRGEKIFYQSFGFFVQSDHLLKLMDREESARAKEKLLEEHLRKIKRYSK